MSSIFITNATQYTGPGVVRALVAHNYHVICHDTSFANKGDREDFARETKTYAIAAQSPEDIYKEVSSIGDVDKFVFNDAYPNTPALIEDICVDTMNAAFQALLVFPFRLSQLFLPELKTLKRGTFVFITSARQLKPEPGFAVATSIRAGATAFASALATEAAPFGIQVNTIQPNYLYSELYYPKAKFVDDPAGRAEIEKAVPAGRLGTPEEFGELVEFFVSGRSPFTTGQEINFTGGWPK